MITDHSLSIINRPLTITLTDYHRYTQKSTVSFEIVRFIMYVSFTNKSGRELFRTMLIFYNWYPIRSTLTEVAIGRDHSSITIIHFK